jgi:hypothetical protein
LRESANRIHVFGAIRGLNSGEFGYESGIEFGTTEFGQNTRVGIETEDFEGRDG